MSEPPLWESPVITDEDINWSTELLRLPPSAFYGKDGTDPRQKILKFMNNVDVAACPGSGKTTLLVAKLAILAEHWQHRTRGICALSHTNVARSEIEKRLSNTTAGRRLLSYPHYIGTIHAFVNDFLAVPWLRRNGYPIKVIDTEICEARRWRQLAYKTRGYLGKQNLDQSSFIITDTNFNLMKKSGKLKFGKDTDTYAHLKKACEGAAKDGYHCYDDVFIWAHDMIDELTEIVDVIRSRFPLLFVDEAQDNSEEQSRILHRLFQAGAYPVVRQRFGDGNQAIFDSINSHEATSDKFADDTIKRNLPDSLRFGQRIADLADPLGLIPYGLKGQGPKQKPPLSGSIEGEHTIFLFENDSATKVLHAYGELLLQTFSEQELRDGVFTAIGQVHRPPPASSEEKRPQHVGDYWPAYDPELARRDPKPRTFVQCVFLGMGRAEATGEAYLAVDKIAEGLLRLSGMNDSRKALPKRMHPHRYVLKLLEKWVPVQAHYRDLVASVAELRQPLTQAMWNDRWRALVQQIAETISGGPLTTSEADEFLKWHSEPASSESSPGAQMPHDNIYRHSRAGAQVSIRVGSIHSVKGETHTATLVMETFWYEHNLKALLPWLSGDESGGTSEDGRQQLRLKIHYVAMTRPAHLLCLAMKRSEVENAMSKSGQTVMQKLIERGWKIRIV
jgi:DNA helicase II / ATP-dependent DNA helicase PcrA